MEMGTTTEGSWEVRIERDVFYITPSELDTILHNPHVEISRGEALFGDLVLTWRRHWTQKPDRETHRRPNSFATLVNIVHRRSF